MPVMINIGQSNMVAVEQVVAVLNPNSAPSKRLRDEAKKNTQLIDATQGHRTRSMIVTSSNHVILTSVEVKTLSARFTSSQPQPVLGNRTEIQL